MNRSLENNASSGMAIKIALYWWRQATNRQQCGCGDDKERKTRKLRQKFMINSLIAVCEFTRKSNMDVASKMQRLPHIRGIITADTSLVAVEGGHF